MALPELLPVSDHDLALLAGGLHGDPHSVLGAHPHAGGVTVRTLKPLASTVTAVVDVGAEDPVRVAVPPSGEQLEVVVGDGQELGLGHGEPPQVWAARRVSAARGMGSQAGRFRAS